MENRKALMGPCFKKSSLLVLYFVFWGTIASAQKVHSKPLPQPIPASICQSGPRPYIDVTCSPYNAKGDGVTDDTAAIQGAINAACANVVNGRNEYPDIYFPPGYYVAKQPQTPSTSPVFSITCPVRFIGGGGEIPQFSNSPLAGILVSAGASPNAAAAFYVGTGISTLLEGVTFSHLLIDGYNEAISIVNGGNIEMDNCVLRAKVTGQADNTPLRISDSLWVWVKGGVLGFNDPNPADFKSLYDAMLIGEAGASGVSTIDYLIHFEDITGFGGAFIYDQRVPSNTNTPSNFTFSNISIEDSANSFFTLASTGSTPVSVDAIELDHARVEDSQASGPVGVLEVQNNMAANGVRIVHSENGFNAFLQTSGSVSGLTIEGCQVNCANLAVDGSGNEVGGVALLSGGLDATAYSGNSRVMPWLRNDPQGEFDYEGSFLGPVFRATAAGNHFSTIAADPSMGYLFSDGRSYGYSTSLRQNAPNTLDIEFASTLPPSGVTAAPTTGGTIAAGTYYYYVQSSQTNQCDPSVNGGSTLSLASNAAVLSGSNNAVTVSWTPPASTLATVTWYCVVRTQSPFYPQTGASFFAALVPFGTNTYTDTIGSGSGSGPWQADPVSRYLTPVHRFTQTSLGVNTLNPQFNLDVNGTARVVGILRVPTILPTMIYSAAGTPLPTCAASINGAKSVVSDAAEPTYRGVYASGGAITSSVICSYNGSTYSWLTD